MDPFVGTLGVLSLFHIIGGIALGTALRQLLHRRIACNALFLMVWGGMFGITPFLFGAVFFGPHGNLLYLGLEIATFIIPVLVVVLIPDWFLESFDSKRIVPVAMGALFVVIGIAIGFTTWSENIVMALLFLLVFGGAGAYLFVTSLVEALKS